MPAKSLIFALSLAALGVAGGPAAAHHSFAMFDQGKEMTLVATVKEFHWTNPHSEISVVMSPPAGQVAEWTIETSSPIALRQKGWTKDTLKPGDKVTVVIHPMKDGTNGGSLVSLTIASGQVLTGV